VAYAQTLYEFLKMFILRVLNVIPMLPKKIIFKVNISNTWSIIARLRV
jgi:hypothetical protein